MTEKLRVLVCGGRKFADMPLLFHTLDGLNAEHPIAVIIEGAARGADSLARLWAKARHVRVEEFPADWRRHGKMAGPLRNTQMLKEGKPDLVVAFPGDAGTMDMVDKAARAKVRVLEISGDKA